mmetsp:Transcript_50356/g.89990  ORF Transcript_50356/g.89990 Transcript_50356/m.89990 type:complete len:247 (+) Transcript_50356:666-1406(+)
MVRSPSLCQTACDLHTLPRIVSGLAKGVCLSCVHCALQACEVLSDAGELPHLAMRWVKQRQIRQAPMLTTHMQPWWKSHARRADILPEWLCVSMAVGIQMYGPDSVQCGQAPAPTVRTCTGSSLFPFPSPTPPTKKALRYGRTVHTLHERRARHESLPGRQWRSTEVLPFGQHRSWPPCYPPPVGYPLAGNVKLCLSHVPQKKGNYACPMSRVSPQQWWPQWGESEQGPKLPSFGLQLPSVGPHLP